MAMLDARKSGPVPRTPQSTARGPLYDLFVDRYTVQARRLNFMRSQTLPPLRDPPVNPERTEIKDKTAFTAEIKEIALALGADAVGIAEFHPNLTFTDAEALDHPFVIVFALSMSFDVMVVSTPD